MNSGFAIEGCQGTNLILFEMNGYQVPIAPNRSGRESFTASDRHLGNALRRELWCSFRTRRYWMAAARQITVPATHTALAYLVVIRSAERAKVNESAIELLGDAFEGERVSSSNSACCIEPGVSGRSPKATSSSPSR